jgi:mRNA-degrading endonuclease toxin of MazEF toxin-antitoxin module
MPWSDDVRVSRLWRFWPFARRWRVVSRVAAEFAETTIVVIAVLLNTARGSPTVLEVIGVAGSLSHCDEAA